MSRRQGTGRIGCAWVTGKQKGLAATSAEVIRTSLAASARLGHPSLPSELLERGRFAPSPFERVFSNTVKDKAGDHACSVTRQSSSRRIDQNQPMSPSPH